MCTQKDSIDCNRAILIVSKFYYNGYNVKNKLENGDIQT